MKNGNRVYSINKHTITDKQAIRKALCMPTVMPDSFLPKELIPLGMSKFKGDHLPSTISSNKQFIIGNEYPVYDFEGQLLVIGCTGVGIKFLIGVWTKIK
jgi:hypothetical protein